MQDHSHKEFYFGLALTKCVYNLEYGGSKQAMSMRIVLN